MDTIVGFLNCNSQRNICLYLPFLFTSKSTFDMVWKFVKHESPVRASAHLHGLAWMDFPGFFHGDMPLEPLQLHALAWQDCTFRHTSFYLKSLNYIKIWQL
jgi:hypothetical protein